MGRGCGLLALALFLLAVAVGVLHRQGVLPPFFQKEPAPAPVQEEEPKEPVDDRELKGGPEVPLPKDGEPAGPPKLIGKWRAEWTDPDGKQIRVEWELAPNGGARQIRFVDDKPTSVTYFGWSSNEEAEELHVVVIKGGQLIPIHYRPGQYRLEWENDHTFDLHPAEGGKLPVGTGDVLHFSKIQPEPTDDGDDS